MATPSFDSFYQAARRLNQGLPLDLIRSKYEERYGRPGVFTQPVSKPAFVAAAVERGAPEDLASEKYEERYNTLPWYQDVGRGLGRAYSNVAGTVGGLADVVGLDPGLMGHAERVRDRFAAESNLAQPFFQGDSWVPNWSLLGRPSWWASGLTEVAGSMGPSLGVGAGVKAALNAPRLGAAAGSLVGGLQEGFGGTYAQARGEGMGRGDAALRGLGMTAGTMGLNYPGISRILNRANTNLAQRGITGLIEGTTELAEEPLEATIMGEDPIEATRQGFGVLPLAALTGGLMPGAASNVAQDRRDEFDVQLREVREAVPPAPLAPVTNINERRRGRPIGGAGTVTTAAGTQIEVQPEIVELSSLVTSDMAEFPGELQPRNRDRDSSRMQVQNIAQNLEPRRLDLNPEADRGAPIIGPDNVVESGNARTMALRQVYESIPENAKAYRDYLESQGYDTTGFARPVLVSRRTSEVDRTQFAVEANQADTMNLGASEQARADARLVDTELLSRYQGGDLDLARNTPFVRGFLEHLPAAQRNDLIDDNGRVSQTGIRRMQGALLAYAYGQGGNLPGLSRMLESTDDNARALTGGLIDAAPYVAELKTRIQDGRVAPEYDVGPALAEAAQKVSDARRNRQTIEEVLRQQDAFNPLTPVQQAAIEFFAGVRNRNTLSSKLRTYAETAIREGDTQQVGMFGEQRLAPEEILNREMAAAARLPENEIQLGQFASAIDTIAQPRRTQEGAHRDRIEREWVAPLVRTWGANAPRINVVATGEELPTDVKLGLRLQFGFGIENDAEGVRIGNDIYLNANKIRKPTDVARLLAHEGVGHHGMETMLGPERFAQVVQQTLSLARTDPTIRKIAEELGPRYTNKETGQLDQETLGKEIIARLAETRPNHSLIQRLLAYVREYLRRMGFDKRFPNVKFSKKDLEALLIRATKHLAKSDMAIFQGGQVIPVPERIAQEMARQAHRGQVDYQGKPYFPHVERVARHGRDTNERIAGYLHDVVEDTDTTLEDLKGVYPQEIVDAVDALTWREDQGESYDDYMQRALSNPIAAAVKFFDARDNMRLQGNWPGSEDMRQRTQEAMVKAWKAMKGPKPGLEASLIRDEATEALRELPKFKGTAFRAPGFEGGPPNVSAFEVYEVELSRGNIDEVSGPVAYALKKLPANSLMFIGNSEQALMDEFGGKENNNLIEPGAVYSVPGELLEDARVLYKGDRWTLLVVDPDKRLDDFEYLEQQKEITFDENGLWSVRGDKPQASLPRQEVDPGLQQVHRNLGKLSRTYAGVTDDAGSAQKAALFEVTGEEAGRRSRANVEQAWKYAMQNQAIRDPRKLLEVMNEIARIVTGGVIPQDKMLREHDVQEQDGSLRYLPADQVSDGLQQFARDLYSIMDTAQPVDLAAFIHRRFNHELHPYSDGVSKITEVLTDWALARRGEHDLIPQMPERSEFFKAVVATKGDMKAWADYMRTLMPTRLQVEQLRRKDADEFNAWLDTLDPNLAQDYRDLIASKDHAQDLAIEFAKLPPGAGARHQLAFARRILSEEPEQTRERYAQLDTMGGLKLDVDEFRELYGPYRENRTGLSLATHEVASAWIKNRWRELLNQPAPPGRQDMALITGGGSGAGKTSVMNENGASQAKVILDAVNGKVDSTDKKVLQAMAAGNRVEYLLIDRPVMDAWAEGVITRALINGRTVPLDIHLKNHVGDGGKNHLGARETARNMILKFGHLAPRFTYRVWSTRKGDWTSYADMVPFEARDKLYLSGLINLAKAIEAGGRRDRNGEWREIYPQHVAGLLPTDYARNERIPQELRTRLEEAARTQFGLSGAAEANLARGRGVAGGGGPAPQASLGGPAQGQLFPPQAPQLNPVPRTRLESGGGSYSSRQFATLDDTEFSVLRETMAFSDDLTAAERAGREPKTWNETEKEALELIVKDPEAVLTGLVQRKLGSTANAQRLEAYGVVLSTALRDVREAAARAAETQSDEDLAVLLSHYEKLAVLQAPYAGYMTEAGRALNILAKAKRAADSAADIIEAAPDSIVEKLRGSVVDDKRQRLIRLAQDIAGSESGAEVISNNRKLHKPGAFDKIYEYWVNSILSGPDTHMVNNASNLLFQLVEGVAQTVGAALPGGTPMRTAMARWNGSLHGIKMGAHLFRKAFKTGLPQMGIEQQKFIEAPHLRAISGRKGELIRLPGRALLAEDEFWKAIAYYGHASELAMRKAMAEGGDVRARFADIMGNLEEHLDIVEEAQREAHRLTFTTKMGPALSALNRALIKTRLGKFIAPFIRTPSNILKEAIRYTPVAGLAIEQVRQDLAGKNGHEARAAQYGRWIVGSTMYMMSGILAAAGDLSGNGPDDPNERRLLMRTGWQPYSLRMNGKWYKYNRLEPVGMVLGLAADSIEIGKFAGGGELDKVYALVMGSLMSNLADKTFLSGVFDFTEAVTDPARYGSRWVSRMTSSFIPNIIAQPTWKADPYVREARTQMERIRSRIPGKREELRPLQDIAGEPIEQTSSPIPGDFRRISEERSDPLAETMLRLGLFRGKPGRTVQRVKLTDEQYHDYSRALQQARWQLLTPYVRSPEFQALMSQQPEQARALLDKLWTKIGSEARIRWLYQNPEVLVKSAEVKARPRAIGSDYIETQ